MRFPSRVIQLDEGSNVIPIRSSDNSLTDGDGLTAFRGLLIAVTASAVFWALCITAVWLIRGRS